MASAISTEGNKGLVIDLEGVAATTGGAIFSMANPEGVPLIILRTTLYVSANSTDAANLSAGIAADATTAGTDIINALAMAAAAGKMYNGATIQGTTKTEITVPALWTTDKFLNVNGSASTVGLRARLFVEYARAA
jgi:hypothetical protein